MLPNFFFGGEKEVSDRGGTAAGAGYSRATHVPYCSSQLEEEGGERTSYFVRCVFLGIVPAYTSPLLPSPPPHSRMYRRKVRGEEEEERTSHLFLNPKPETGPRYFETRGRGREFGGGRGEGKEERRRD